MQNGTFHPQKKPNDRLLQIHSLSSNPPNLIKLMPNSIQERLSKNLFNVEIFNTAKYEYKDAPKKSGFKFGFKYTKTQRQKPKHRSQSIIQFNPPFKKAVSISIARIFLRLISRHFPKSHSLQKIFQQKYSEGQFQLYPKYVQNNQLALCNCRVKEEYHMDGKYQTMDTACNCCVTSPEPQKIYFGSAEGK